MDDDITTDLAAWAARRDEAAFGRLVERYSGVVSAVCRRQLGTGASADEATQAVFIILARRAGSVSAPALASWLYRVAMGVCGNARRMEARRTRHERAVAKAALPPDPDEDTGLPVWAGLRPHLDDALAALSSSDREVVISYFLDGLSQAAMAKRLGISESTAGRRIAGAVDHLREWFSRRGLSVGASLLVAGLLSEAGAAEPTLIAACTQAVLHPASAAGAASLAGSATVGGGKLIAAALASGLLVGGAFATVHFVDRQPPTPLAAETVAPVVQVPVAQAQMVNAGFHMDFEDGRMSPIYHKGRVEPGPARPGNKFSITGERSGMPEFPNTLGVVFHDFDAGLFSYAEGIEFSCDYWADDDVPYIEMWMFDQAQKTPFIMRIGNIVHGRWSRLSAKLRDFSLGLPVDEGQKMIFGDRFTALQVTTQTDKEAKLYFDNLEFSIPAGIDASGKK